MVHKIKAVQALENFSIEVLFQNGVIKIYDMRNLCTIFPQFWELQENKELFYKVTADIGGYGVSWNDELDLDAESIWENGIATQNVVKADIVISLAEELVRARDIMGMTQKQLSEATGIYQADISKIERGIANPSLLTLRRLAEGMGMDIRIEFLKRE